MASKDIERGLAARYLFRFFSRRELPFRAVLHVLFWLQERWSMLGIDVPEALAEVLRERYAPQFSHRRAEDAYQRARGELLAALDRAALETSPPEPLARNVEMLVAGLDIQHREAAWRVLGLVVCCARYNQLLWLVNEMHEVAGPAPHTISILTSEPQRVVEQLLSPSSELFGAGLLRQRDGGQLFGHDGRYVVPARISSRLDQSFENFEALRDALLGEPQPPIEVGLADYEHVAADRDLIIAVLKGATAERAAGVNVLLYGPPGSGKTELVKLAADAAGIELYAAGEARDGDHEQDRVSRLSDLVFSQRLLADQHGTSLLFDEMEDVAVHLIRRGGSKVFLNRLLETNPVPVLWTSNEIASIDPALLRRMTLAIELKRPPAAQRKRIIRELTRRAGLAVTDVEIDRLAERIDATPAVLQNAIRAARLAGGGAETVERAAKGIVRAVSGVTQKKQTAIPAFDPELTRASRDLLALADQLVGGSTRAVSLCLSGPPGTGKSAFARYLAGRLGLDILQKRASDLLGPYVGQTERQIADAFEEAREAGALLVFDEADSLLMDRRDAVRSWEVSQVNEMLTWMEEHPLPICFTTNLMGRIDTASLRRFTFHVRFEFMDRRAMARAWRVFFGLEAPPPGGLDFENLTPGDFAKARKQAEVLGIVEDQAQLVALVADISRGKPEAGGTLGFVR